MSGLTHCMYTLKVVVAVSVTLHGTKLMKYLEHQSLRGRNLPRRAHYKHARNSAPIVVQEELGSENEEDEDNQDPYDDADVTDCEDDPCDANGGGGDETASNILGEFDDGY